MTDALDAATRELCGERDPSCSQCRPKSAAVVRAYLDALDPAEFDGTLDLDDPVVGWDDK